VTIHRVFDFDAARQLIALDCFAEKLERILGFAASFNHAINAQLLVSVSLDNLPAAGTTDDHLEVLAIRTPLDLRKQVARVMRVNGHSRRAKDGRVNTRSKRNAERVMSRNSNHTGARADELVQVVRKTCDH